MEVWKLGAGFVVVGFFFFFYRVPFLIPQKNRAGSRREFLSVCEIASGKGQDTISSFCSADR